MNAALRIGFGIMLSLSGIAQSPSFQNFALPRKMESLAFNKILQDKRGFLWLGTEKGLFRFDGVQYKNYTALPDEHVTALAEDSIGRIWIGFKNGSMAFIEEDVITPFQPAEGLSFNHVSDILFDRRGVMWFSTYGDGIYYYRNARLYRLDETDGMPDLYGYDLEEDWLGNIWVGTDGGVAICSLNDGEVQIHVVNYANGLPDNIIKKISKTPHGKILFATEDAGIFYFNPTKNISTPLLKSKWLFGSITDFILVNNWVWIATESGLVILDVSEKNATIIATTHERVTCLTADMEGGVWIGNRSSLFRTKGDQLQFLDPEGDKNVLSVAVSEDGTTWYSTSDGLFRIEKKDGETITNKPLSKTPWANKKVISLHTDPMGFVWIGFFGDGVIRLNPKNDQIQDFKSQVRNGNVVNISGKNNTIWLATLGGATRIVIGKDFTVTNFSPAEGLSTDYLYQVFIDSQNRVWFATDRAGIDMLDDSGFHHFKENLNSSVVYGLAEDSLHQIWANVQNDGLYFFDGTNFNAYTDKERFHNTNFSSFTSGIQNQLIVAHHAGLDIFDPQKNKFSYIFNEGPAIPKIPNLNAVAKNEEGRIFIGTSNGLIIYDHYNDQKQKEPIPFIEQLEVNGHVQDLQLLDHLSFDQNTIKISFTGFWYQNPGALNFSYRLENFDEEWFSTESRTLTYSKLPPGEYTFVLKASDSDNFLNQQISKVHFIIDPPFWQTMWFYGIAISLATLVLFIAFRQREKGLITYNRELEAKVRERTSEIEKKSDEIKLQADEIKRMNENLETMVKERTVELELKNKALEEYAFMNAHKLRAPLARVLGLINLLTKVEIQEADKIYLELLQKSSVELDVVVRSMTQTLEQSYLDHKIPFYN